MSRLLNDHCKRGHRLAGDNLYVAPTSGKRSCKACSRLKRKGLDRHPRETLLRVDNSPLRERFLTMRARGETSADAVARKLGWMTRKQRRGRVELRPDTQRLQRALGVIGDGERFTLAMSYDNAVEIAHALGMDPHEAGV